MTTISQQRNPWITLFEWLYFPLLLIIPVSIMSYCVVNDVYVELAFLGLPLSIMIVTFLLERWHPRDPDWNRSRGDLQPDIASIAIVAFGIEPIFKAIGPAMAVWILLQLNVPATFSVLNQLPLWLEVICVLLIIEFAKYWFHRLGHENMFWWRLHSVHHSVKRLHMLNGFRIHPIYHIITFFLGVMPCLLLGASDEAMIINTVLLAVGGAIQHCNIKLRFGFLNYIFNTNELHRWHHSKVVKEGNTNYGAVLIVYDVIFGTHYYRPDADPNELGIQDEEYYPMNNYWKQLTMPFRWKKVMPK